MVSSKPSLSIEKSNLEGVERKKGIVCNVVLLPEVQQRNLDRKRGFLVLFTKRQRKLESQSVKLISETQEWSEWSKKEW